ncbi:hypothetical protein RF11_16160 [Thelohanellus kitauei]|uniref:Integrase zinc-binding domain-containing protein n=1 Tax=Thelohanellus kitauei TaxID=669202 RepID=A0A0C2N4G0_THEKT|nr:hypothetical protein RF11_16160 [Thelohanellus kitauei]
MPDTYLKLKDIFRGLSKPMLWCDISAGNERPLVTVAWRGQIFDSFHCLSHPAIRATKRLIDNMFAFQGLKKEVSQWARSCKASRTSKIPRHVKTLLANFNIPSESINQMLDMKLYRTTPYHPQANGS